jgi:hypothetical protein
MKKLIFLEGLSKQNDRAVFRLDEKLIVVMLGGNTVYEQLIQDLKFDYLWMLASSELPVLEHEMFAELERISATQIFVV